MTKRGISLTDEIPAVPVTPSFRSADRSDLPARVADAARDYKAVTGRTATRVMLGTQELLELMEILSKEWKQQRGTERPPIGNVTCCGLTVVKMAHHASMLEVSE